MRTTTCAIRACSPGADAARALSQLFARAALSTHDLASSPDDGVYPPRSTVQLTTTGFAQVVRQRFAALKPKLLIYTRAAAENRSSSPRDGRDRHRRSLRSHSCPTTLDWLAPPSAQYSSRRRWQNIRLSRRTLSPSGTDNPSRSTVQRRRAARRTWPQLIVRGSAGMLGEPTGLRTVAATARPALHGRAVVAVVQDLRDCRRRRGPRVLARGRDGKWTGSVPIRSSRARRWHRCR